MSAAQNKTQRCVRNAFTPVVWRCAPSANNYWKHSKQPCQLVFELYEVQTSVTRTTCSDLIIKIYRR